MLEMVHIHHVSFFLLKNWFHCSIPGVPFGSFFPRKNEKRSRRISLAVVLIFNRPVQRDEKLALNSYSVCNLHFGHFSKFRRSGF